MLESYGKYTPDQLHKIADKIEADGYTHFQIMEEDEYGETYTGFYLLRMETADEAATRFEKENREWGTERARRLVLVKAEAKRLGLKVSE